MLRLLTYYRGSACLHFVNDLHDAFVIACCRGLNVTVVCLYHTHGAGIVLAPERSV